MDERNALSEGARPRWPGSQAAGLNEAQNFIVWHPAAVTGLSALVAKRAARGLEGLARLSHREPGDGLSAEGIRRTKSLLSTARRSTEREQRPHGGSGVSMPPASRSGSRRESLSSGFPAEAKAKVRAMVDDLTKAFGKRIDALDWMTPATKAKARKGEDALCRRRIPRQVDRLLVASEIVKGDALAISPAPRCSNSSVSSRN